MYDKRHADERVSNKADYDIYGASNKPLFSTEKL
jgi:hypothetical protein